MRGVILLLTLLTVAGCGRTWMDGTPLPSDAGRYQMLGIYKPKGFAIVFDSATGLIETKPLPPELRTAGE